MMRKSCVCLVVVAACGTDTDDGGMQNVGTSALEQCAGTGGLVEAWSANNQHGPITSIVAGSVIVVGGADGSVKQWSFDGGAPEYLSPFTKSGAEVGGLALTPDAHVVAATKLGEVTEWRLSDAGEERSMTIADASLAAVAVRPDGFAAITGTSTGELFVLDRKTSDRTQLTSELWGVSALAYGAGNTLFTAGHYYGVPRVEQWAADAPLSFTNAWQDDNRSGHVRAVDVDATGTQLVVGGDGFVAVLAAGQLDAGPTAITDVPEHLVTGVTLLPGGEMFATTGSEGTLKIWRTATAQLVTSLAIPASAGIARDSAGTRLLSAGADGKVYAYGCR